MDRKTKIQLLLDMQENPEQYSEEELKTMLEDDEVILSITCFRGKAQTRLAESGSVHHRCADGLWHCPCSYTFCSPAY